MTHLEQIIKAAVERSTVTTITAVADRAAEDLARDILRDESFRDEMRQLIRRHFTNTMSALANGDRPRKRRRRSR